MGCCLSLDVGGLVFMTLWLGLCFEDESRDKGKKQGNNTQMGKFKIEVDRVRMAHYPGLHGK